VPETGAEPWTIGWGSTLDSQGPLLRSRLEDDGRLCCRFTYNCGHRFRLALVSVDGERASSPVYVSGVDWGLPGFRRHPDHQEPAAAAGRWEGTALTTGAMLTSESDSVRLKP